MLAYITINVDPIPFESKRQFPRREPERPSHPPAGARIPADSRPHGADLHELPGLYLGYDDQVAGWLAVSSSALSNSPWR